jgi:hypothetical protein
MAFHITGRHTGRAFMNDAIPHSPGSPAAGSDDRAIDLQRAMDRWFFRRGLPQFALDRSSTTAIWTRASPFLFVTFLFLIATSAADIRGIAGGVAIAVAAVVLLVVFATVNRRAGRPLLALPRRVGWGVLAAYVVVPTLLSGFASLRWLPPLETVGVAVGFLAFAWVVTWAALIPLIGWAVRWTTRQFGSIVPLVTRALPLLLLFVTIIYLTTEVWQVAGTLPARWLWLTIGLFILLGLCVIAARLPQEIHSLEATGDRASVEAACAGTPLAPVVAGVADLGEPQPLTRLQRLNIGVVMTMAQVVQVALFGVVVWLFFLLFGTIAVSIPVQAEWLGGLNPVDVLWHLAPDRGLTRESLRVATFLAGFSAFYVTVYSASDATYREHFFADIGREMERAMAVRQAYAAHGGQRGPRTR